MEKSIPAALIALMKLNECIMFLIGLSNCAALLNDVCPALNAYLHIDVVLHRTCIIFSIMYFTNTVYLHKNKTNSNIMVNFGACFVEVAWSFGSKLVEYEYMDS